MLVTRCRLRLKCDGTRAETIFRLSAKRRSPFKSVGASVQSTTGSRGVRISFGNSGCTMFRGSVKSTGYPLHSPVSPSLPLPCVTCAITFQLDSTYSCKQHGLGFVSHFQSFRQHHLRTAWGEGGEWGEGLGSAEGTCNVSYCSGMVLSLGVTGKNPSFVTM
jgi:hypothetical protein